MKITITDSRISEGAERALLKRGYTVLKLPRCPHMTEAISSHPDSLIFRIGNTVAATCGYCETASYVFTDMRELCPSLRFAFIDVELGDRHPQDARMNAVAIGKFLLANKKTVVPEIIELAEKEGYTLLNVNQSYPNCSILKLNDENVITSDEGIARVLEENGINVLRIRQGGISLPPYDYGFIGGASGVDGDTVYFLGDIMTHPDGEKITEFIESLGMKAVSLTDGELVDLGGILFI